MTSAPAKLLFVYSFLWWCLCSQLASLVVVSLTPDEAQAWRNASDTFDWQQKESSAQVKIVGRGVEDAAGNLYFVGAKTYVTATDAVDDQNIFIARINADDTIAWTREFGTNETDAASFVTLVNEPTTDSASGITTAAEMIYVVGTTWGFMDEGAHALNGFGQFGGRDVVLIKLTKDGDKLWTRQFGSTANDFGLGVVVDPTFGTLLLTGGCITDQVDLVVEVKVDTVLEAREPFAQYETQLMDSHTRTGVRPQQYEFAASFNFQGDLLDFTMDGGITITPRRQRIEENGVKGEYSVVLNRKPLNDVTVRANVVMLTDPSGVRIQQLRLPNDTNYQVTFTSANWNREQIVKVTAVDDFFAEGVHYAVITHSSSSLDPNFNGSQTPFLYGRNLTFQVDDNDFASVRLSRAHMYVGEGEMNDSYDIVLSSKPWYPVNVTIVAMHPNQTQVRTPLITFIPETWNLSQTVVISAVDDSVSEVEFGGLHYGGRLIHYSESRDFRYNTRRPRCFDVPNCDPAASATTTCLKPDLTAQVSVRVCDLTSECSFTLSNGACVTDVLASSGGIPARFGSRPLDPSISTSANETAISYTALQSLLLREQLDANTSRPRDLTTGLLSYVPPPPELRGFVLSFLGLLNLEQVQRLGQSPIRVLHAVCAGISRLETHRWAFEEWPSGYVNQILQVVLTMFPDIIDERRVWNCGAAVFPRGSSLNVTIWDNDPGVTLSSASLSVAEASATDTSADALATYSIVLNAQPSSNGGQLQPAMSMCSLPGSDICGFWDDFSALAAKIYSQPSGVLANVSIAIIGNSQITVSPSIVTFTTANWFVPQWISVRAVNDAIAEAEAAFRITHRVQNSPYGYTNTTAFWLQGTLPPPPWRQFPTNATISGYELKMPYNTIPTVLNAPAHQHVNVRVQDDDSAGVKIIVNQPERDLITKESSDTIDWVGDYATAFAFSDISLSTKAAGDTGSALASILVLSPNATSLMKFHLPCTHKGDSKLAFGFATLRFYQTPFKIFNVSDASEDSTLSSSDAGSFTKTYRLRITLVQNSWSRASVQASGNASVPGDLAFAATKSINVTAIVEKSRPIDLNVTALVAQLLPTRASVASFKIEVLSDVANTTQSVTQMCSSLFERKLRPTLQLGYRFPNLLLGGAATQSSTAVTVGSGPASVATDGDRNVNKTASTVSELEPYWEMCFDETKKVGQVALFLPEFMNSVKASNGTEVAVNIVGIATLRQISNDMRSLSDAMAFGCPDSCPLVHRTTIRKGIILWDIQAGMRCLRIYREGTGSLELVEVEAYDSFVSVATTGDGSGLRSRLKSDWTAQKASESWRIQQSAKRSEDENLALGMATRQSSTSAENALSYLAVDGQRAATWDSAIIQNASAVLASQSSQQQQLAPGSTRTLLENNPWWEVDLGAIKPISTVVLYPYLGMPDRGFCSSTSSATSSSTKYPGWSGDLYSYSRTDSLLMLQDPFNQDFEVLITDVSLATASDPTSVNVTRKTTLSFSCANGTASISWVDAFTRGRFVTVRKQGLGILMLNEVRVHRWNPGTTPRYLLLDFYGFGINPMALSSIQLFPPTDSLIAPGSNSGGFALPIAYEIHSVSSQLATAGAGSAASLKSVMTADCYVAAKASFHEWIVLDLHTPTRVGLIEMDTSVAKCGVNVTQANSISIAAYGAALDGIRSSQATSALTVTSDTCKIDSMGVLKSNASAASCKAFACGYSACSSHLTAVGTTSTLVLSDFSDVVLLGMVDFLPISRLPLSVNEHRAMVLRDNPVALWAFDDQAKIPVISTGVDATTKRATGALELATSDASKQLVVDDAKESTFYSNDVLLQASMSAFSLEFWVFLTQNLTLSMPSSASADSVVNIVTMDSASVAFASIGVSKTYPGGFFKFVDSVSGKSCLAALDGDVLSSSTTTLMWTHVIASYDPSTATIALTMSYNLPGGGEMSQQSAKMTCTLAMFNVQRKTLNFGSYKPIAGATSNLPGFVGKLSNVAWYLRALGPFEILDHYHDFISGTTETSTFAHNSYALRLKSKPLAPVAISINAEAQCYRFNLCNVSVVPSSVVITPENWMELTQIHVIATNDQLYEGDHITQLQFQATSKPSYQLMSTASTLDLFALANGSNTTTVLTSYEHQVREFYRDLQLKRVLIDRQVLVLRQNALMALQVNWSSVRIDYSVVVNEPYNEQLSIDTLAIDLIDTTVPGIEFSTNSLLVSENGKGNDYQVLLLSEPKSPVTISISVAEDCYRNCSTMVPPLCPSQTLTNGSATLICGDESTPSKLCNITISPSTLYFSGTNWSLPQTVRVVAVDDQLDEADLHLTSITTTSRSLDPVYDALFLPDIVVAVEDNDMTDVLYSTKYVTLSEKASNGSTYRSTFNYSTTNFYMLSLATEPWANVTIAMSNEANKSCYRPCGYHFDQVNCGLPRQQSVTSVRLSTNSTREIHRIALSIPKVIEVQRIVTYAEHVDQIFKVQVTGGFAEEVQSATFTFSDAFKLRFKSADAMNSAVTYGRTFRIGATDRATSTASIDGFASASQVETALSTLFKVTSGFKVNRTLLYDQSTLSWTITFARLVNEDAAFPTLSVTTDTLFEGTLTIARKSAAVAPTGNILVRYGASDSQPLQVPILSTVSAFQTLLGSLPVVYTVSVARTISASAYGFEYTVTFQSVDTFYSLQADNKSLVAAPKAVNNVTILITETQSPERINGAFTAEYISSFNSTNNVTRTNALLWNASEAQVQSEISRINGVGNVSVSRRRLTAEGGMEWTVEFSQNNGQMRPLTVKSVNLTGRNVVVALDTVLDGESLGGTYVVEMGGRFKKMNSSTQRVYWMDSPLQNTTALSFNTTAVQLQQALVALNITELTTVTREDLDCDAFAVCNGYTWTISYVNSPGDVPPIRVYGTNNTLTGAGATISAATVANGTYIGGQFSLKLDLYDLDTKVWYSGTTWNLPVNVSALGMDEALEAIPFVRSNREAEFDPETRLWRGIKFDKGVRVYRDGPYLDGGYTWRLEWAIEDYIRFQDLHITINASLATQEVEPLAVPTQFDLMGYPRCSAIPTSRFQADKSDPFGLRGWCVYDILNVTIQERFLCNYTVEDPWIVFTPENWCIPQKVQLSAVDDFIDEATVQNGNVTFSNVTHTVFSDDLIYVKLPLSAVLTVVESDDFAEVLVSETNLQVREDGLLDAEYLLQLKTEPLYSVKIVVLPWLDGDNTGCYRFGLCNLTIPTFEFVFTPMDWDIPQTVVVKATDDDLDEYDIHATGISHIAYSDDLKYNKIDIPKINVTVVDNDVSALKVFKKSVAVTEGGAFDTYDVVLGSEPFAKVTVAITNVGKVGNYANTTPSALLFTWKNWNISQTVRVDAVDDFTQDEVNSSSTMVHTITSNDFIYAKLKDLARVTVNITDNDVSGLSLSTQLMNASESNVTVYTYGVRLNSEPWQPVVVLPNASHGCYVRVLSSETLCNATILTPRLYFGPGNWSIWQNVSFLAFDDWLVETPIHQALITHTTVSKDPLYQVSNYTGRNASLRLRIADNDLAFVNISLLAAGSTNRSQLHVAEGGFNDSYRVFLNSEPYEDVLLTLRPAIETIVDQNDKTVFHQAQVGVTYGTSSSAISIRSNISRAIQIVFTALDWNQPRVVTVFAIDDKIAEDPTQYSSIDHAVASVDAKYNVSNSSIGVTSVQVMVNDKEAIPPPIPVAALFDASGTKLQVTFDSSVYHAETMAVRTDLTASDALALGSLYTIKLKQFACSLVFDFSSSKYSLGKGTICYWLDLKNLRMELGSGATISVKDSLLLNECAVFVSLYCQSTNVIRARSTSRSYTQASVVVQAPSDIVKPNPVLMVPEDAGSCGTWAVDGTLSQGAGGRPFAQMFWSMLPKTFLLTSSLGDADASLTRAKLLYQSLGPLCLKYTTDWKTGKSSSVFVSKADLSANPDLAFVTTMAQLRSACYLRSLAQSATGSLSFKMQINSTLLEAGVGYSVGLELTNAFDQRVVLMKDVQVRSLPGPSLFVVGDRSLEVTRVGDPISLQVDATVSCTEVIGTLVGYVWTASSAFIGGTSSATTYTAVDLSKANVAKDPRVFKIPRTALEAEKSYRFQVEGYMVNNSRASNSTAVIIVNVTSGALTAAITGGSRTIGERDTLVLNGTSSFDPDLSTTPFSFSWACVDVTNTSLTEPQTCINAFASSAGKVVPLDLSSSNGALLSLAPFSLQQNRTLTFVLTVSKTSATGKTRTSNTSSTVWTLPGSVPDVTVAASAAKIVASSRVALTAQVKSTYPFTSRWVQAQGDLVLPTNDGTNASATSDAFALPLTSLNNMINKNKLTPGLTYIFRLIATDVNGNQGFGSVTIKVNSPPSSGRFSVTPTSGYGAQDLFALSCAEWTDDLEDLPLKYSFGVIGTSDFNALVANASNDSGVLGALLKTKTVPIVSEQLLPTASVTMLPPSALKESENVTIIAFISDSLGGFAFNSESIEVLLPAAAKSNPMGFANGLLGLGGDANASDASQRTKFLLSAASILQGAYSSSSNGTDGCLTADSNGKICSDHGACDPNSLKCVCEDAYMGTNCEFQVSAVRTLNTVILSSLNDSSQVAEPTASALSQQALIMDTVIQSSPAAFNEGGLAQVASLSSGIVENAFTLQDQGEFLDSAGKTVLDSLSTVVAISSGTTVTPATSASVLGLKGHSRRLAATPLASTAIDCSVDTPESNQTRATFGNTIGTLLSLTAIASKDALPDEDAIQISSAQIQAIASAGTSFKSSGSGPGLAMKLTEPAVACLEAELFLSAFVLAKPPHSLCSLNEAKQLSASTVFAVHSKAALSAVISGTTTSIKVQKLSSKSLCVAQAAAKVTSAVIATSAKRRLAAAEDSGLNGTSADALTAANAGGGSELAWNPLIALTIPHLRPLSAIEQSNFTTACNVWNAQTSAWDAEICFKDDATSTPLVTVCYCTEIAKLEVLVTLEERLDYYALYKDLYRNEPSSVIPAVAGAMLFWLFLLGSRVGQRRDSTDEKKHKEKTIKGLNRAKWGELQERTTGPATAVLEDFTAFYARKKLETQSLEAENNASRLAEHSTVADAITAALSGDDGNEEPVVLADAVTAATAIDPNVILPNEARTLFGATKTLETQYALTRGCLRFCNAVVIVLGVVLVFVGVDFHQVLGNSTSELLLNTYLTLFSLALIAQLAFVTIAFKYLDDFESMPSALLSTLAQVWNALSTDVKEEIEAFYGCCGFVSIKEASACPEEALDAVPPRTCSHVLTAQAREFFGHSFVYLQVLFLVEAICIALANILVKWRHLRLQQLAGEPASSVNGETSTKRAMLNSPLNVVLLCTLPSLYYLLSCVVLFAVFYGIDMVVQLNFVSNAVISALFGVEIGGLVIAMAVVYLVILLRGIHALAYRDIRGLQWVVALSLAFLIVSFGVSQFFWGIGDNLLIDPVLIEKTETRYLTLPRDVLVKLELAMECCGFDSASEGTCVTNASSSGDQHLQIRTCRSIVEQILTNAIAVLNTRVAAIVIAEAVVFALSVALLIRLRRFAGKSEVHPADLAMAAPVESDEYTTAFDIFVHNVCAFVLVLLNVLASVLGLVVLWAGIDAIYQLNVLHISYLLQTFDRRIGVHLVGLGGGLEFFAWTGFAMAWKRSRRVFLVYMVTGLALFASTFGAMGVSYRFAHTALSSDATNFRLEELWKAAAPTTKGFVQNAFTCCGYERSVASNGTAVFSDMAQATFWTQTSETSSAPAYSRSLQSSSSEASGSPVMVTHRTLTETQTHTFTQAVCPPNADTGCSTVMKRYLTHVARYTFKSCIALLSFLVVVLTSASVLFLRQGKKTPWKQSWAMVFARTGLLTLSFGSIFASLTTLFIAVDLVLRWSIFSSSLLQLMFAFSIGIALLVYATLGLGVNVYTLYAAVDNVVHQIFFQCLGRGLFALSLWLGGGLTGYLSSFSADTQHWEAQLSTFLDHKWNTLSPYTQHLISLDYQCCGFNDPIVVKGKGLVFDRPATGYTCPLSSARGCQHVLVAQISSSFGWLFVYLLSLAVVETLLLALGVVLLKQLKRIKVEEWFAIESRVRYTAGKYKSEARKNHLALSLFHSYDSKFTRAQRLTSILCSVLTSLAIFSGYFATKGCYRTSLKSCEQPDVWGVLGMGLLYGGVCGYAAQCCARFVFELIRHRCDDESSEVASARQRKEKVLLFRSLFQRRRPHPRQSVPTATDVPSDKVGVSSTTVSANSLAPSTMDSSHATTEERWFMWLLRFVYRLYHLVAGGLFLVSCGIGTLMGLVLIGYSNILYGVKIDQGPKELLILSMLIALVALLAWLAVDMRDRKRSGSHVVFIAVAIVSLLLMACALLGVYMVYEVTADTSSSTAASTENWSVRKTGFSVVERLDEAWKAEASSYFRNRVQQDLQCCGLRDAGDFAFRPCPTGTSVQVEYEARSVNGSALVKAQSEVRDLDGCLPKMLEPFHGIADTVAYFAIGICLAQFLLICSAVFLAYDVVVSKDSKLKLRVSDKRKADVRQTFEKVVGLKIAAPARGKILSKMLSSSLDSVAPAIATELAAASLVAPPQSHGDHQLRRPSVSSASKLASLNAPADTVLPPQRRKSISQVRTSLDRGNDATGHHSHEEIASVPYPVSIVYVVFTLCGVWIALMLYLVFQSSMALGKATAWYCVLCWGVGLGFHFLVIEPGVIFSQIVWSTLGAWWAGTWVVRVIRYGREALRIKPDAATAAARYYASLSLYERIRFNAAVRVQRRLLTRVTRRRYLQLVREKRREAHRSLAEQRRLTVKKAIEGFTEDEVRAFALIFKDADTAQLGLVSHSVISQSIYQLGVRVAPELVFQFLEKLDPAYADLVDFEHFLYGMHCVRMHHQEEQNAAVQAALKVEAGDTKALGVMASGVKEEFVSPSARFGPAADPQSKIFVKRQNLLRELKEKRESLSYKLMSKVGKLPPLLQRGKSGGAKANAGPAASLKHELSLDDVSEQSLTRDSSSFASETAADEVPPTGAFVILQNRKLSPKKRALEMVLKKKHRDDRGGKAGGSTGVRDGGGGGKTSPSKTASSPTQRAKAMVQNWKMPSPRGWSNANAKAEQAVEASIDTVIEEENEGEAVAAGHVVPRRSLDPADRQVSTESIDAFLVETAERSASSTFVDGVTKEADPTAEARSAAKTVQSALSDSPSDPSAIASEVEALGSDPHAQGSEGVHHDVVEVSVEQKEEEGSVNSAGGDEVNGTLERDAREVRLKQDARQSIGNGEAVEADGDEAKQEEPKPFGTYMLLNKQAPSAGKSKIMEKILQKKKLVETSTSKVAMSEDSTQEDEEKGMLGSQAASKSLRGLGEGASDRKLEGGKAGDVGLDAAAEVASEGKDPRPKTSEKKATGAAKSSLEKALKKKSLGVAAGKQSGLRKPATPKGL
ncbi:hypothetical protein Gpo141_00006873 [Globisporangium polare]